MHWASGFYDQHGLPRLSIHMGGGLSELAGLDDLEFLAVINTSFTGFVSVPLVRSLPLRLSLTGAASLERADGSIQNLLTAWGRVTVAGRRRWGDVLLDPAAQDVVVGREFLHIFETALVATSEEILLFESSPAWLEHIGDSSPRFRVCESGSVADPPAGAQEVLPRSAA